MSQKIRVIYDTAQLNGSIGEKCARSFKPEPRRHVLPESVRHQLSDTSVEVIEVAPPAVSTDLGGTGQHKHGEPLDAFADGIFKGLEEGKLEIGYGTSVARLRMPRDEVDQYVENMYNTTKNSIE
ncbi:hypothetical protein D3C72_1502320 [compost metagenome]